MDERTTLVAVVDCDCSIDELNRVVIWQPHIHNSDGTGSRPLGAYFAIPMELVPGMVRDLSEALRQLQACLGPSADRRN